MLFFFFNDTATTEIYTLSLHDALPIFARAIASAPTCRPTASPRTKSGCGCPGPAFACAWTSSSLELRVCRIEVGEYGGGRARHRPAVGFEPAATARPETISACGIRLGLVSADRK